jgi:adenylate kinase
MDGVIGVTGTPGTGKKSIAPIVASKLRLKCVGLNDLSVSYGLVSGTNGEVDTLELRRAVRKEVTGRAVVYGHLVPYALDSNYVDKAVVLRCEPGVLKGRLLKRKYPPRKLVDNVEAELIGLVSSEAYESFGDSKTFEVDTTYSSPTAAAETTLEILKENNVAPPRIDWTTNYDSGAKLRLLLSTGAE